MDPRCVYLYMTGVLYAHFIKCLTNIEPNKQTRLESFVSNTTSLTPLFDGYI